DPSQPSGANAQTTVERSEDLKEQLSLFFQSYTGSREEAVDFSKSYAACDGDFRKMVREHLLFDNGDTGAVRRLHALGSDLLRAGTLSATDKWRSSSSPQGVRRIER